MRNKVSWEEKTLNFDKLMHVLLLQNIFKNLVNEMDAFEQKLKNMKGK